MQSHGIELDKKPMVKNLNCQLLKFMQGSEILEKDFTIPEFDGKQVKLAHKRFDNIGI